MMEAGLSAKPAPTSRSEPIATTAALAKIWRCFADIGAAAKAFLRRSHSGPVEGQSHDAEVETAVTAPPAADVNINTNPEINAVAHSVPDQQEIERRRNLIRILFNDFWSGASSKPAGFAQRLDEAEDYLNERLAANGESWRLDAKTRVMLGLAPRSHTSTQ